MPDFVWFCWLRLTLFGSAGWLFLTLFDSAGQPRLTLFDSAGRLFLIPSYAPLKQSHLKT